MTKTIVVIAALFCVHAQATQVAYISDMSCTALNGMTFTTKRPADRKKDSYALMESKYGFAKQSFDVEVGNRSKQAVVTLSSTYVSYDIYVDLDINNVGSIQKLTGYYVYRGNFPMPVQMGPINCDVVLN